MIPATSRFQFQFQANSESLIPIPILVKSGIIPESIPILELESCTTAKDGYSIDTRDIVKVFPILIFWDQGPGLPCVNP